MDRGLVVVDIGNSSIKIGLFTAEAPNGLPRPVQVTSMSGHPADFSELEAWLPEVPLQWRIGSVKRKPLEQLTDWLTAKGARHSFRIVTHEDLALSVETRQPAAVGIDRLAAALAANLLRDNDKAAIVVDAGSAITIDVISPAGAFLGGSIAPGLQLRLEAMHRGTDKLPLVTMPSEAPEVIGRDTESAILSGAFWSVATGIDGVISRIRNELDCDADVFLTGGGMQLVLAHLRSDHHYEPHLVLSGLAMSK